MGIRTKSIYERAEKTDGIRALITRYYPRGVKKEHFDAWIRELSPSRSLLAQYKEGRITWTDFEVALLSELRDSLESRESIRMLNDLGRTQNITLLCYEKDDQRCHRHLIKTLIESPESLDAHFVPEDADNHEGAPMQRHVANKKTRVVPRLSNV